MKSFKEMLNDQQVEVEQYRAIAQDATNRFLIPRKEVLGVLLTGSVARGDARKGPFGLYIDITVIVENINDVNLTEIFGPSIEPYIPKHCVMIENTGVAFEVMTLEDINNIRSNCELIIFAKQEAVVLYDRNGLLAEWKETCFKLSNIDIKNRALQQYFRFNYLTSAYRIEKWKYRKAWLQLVQIGNEALECYCSFLYCINGWFIPRKDWLVYLTYDLPIKMPDHTDLLNELYAVETTEQGMQRRTEGLKTVEVWMRGYCIQKKWIT